MRASMFLRLPLLQPQVPLCSSYLVGPSHLHAEVLSWHVLWPGEDPAWDDPQELFPACLGHLASCALILGVTFPVFRMVGRVQNPGETV